MRVQDTTGLTTEQCAELCRLVEAEFVWTKPGTRTRTLSLESALFLTLAYFRHNVTEKFLATFFGVSQATVSRTIADTEVMIDVVLDSCAPELRAAANETTTIVEGTLLPADPGRRRQDCTPGSTTLPGTKHPGCARSQGPYSRDLRSPYGEHSL